MVDATSIVIIIIVIMVLWYVYSTTLLYRKKRKKYSDFVNFLKNFCKIDNVKLVGTNLFVSGRNLFNITKFNIAVNLISTDIIFLWLTEIAFGRKDLVILKGELSKEVSNEIEIVNLRIGGGRILRKELLKRGWKEIYNKFNISVLTQKYLYLNDPPNFVWRISLRNSNPPLLIMFPFKHYDKIKEIAKYVSNLS